MGYVVLAIIVVLAIVYRSEIKALFVTPDPVKTVEAAAAAEVKKTEVAAEAAAQQIGQTIATDVKNVEKKL